MLRQYLKFYLTINLVLITCFQLNSNAQSNQSKHLEDSLLTIIDTTTSESIKAYQYFTLANNLYALDFKKCIEYNYTSLKITEEILAKDSTNEWALLTSFRIKSNLGRAFLKLENHEVAIKYAEEALQFFLSTNIVKDIVIAYNNIAGVYFTIKEYEIAKKYFLDALEYDSDYKAILKTNLAYIDAKQGKYKIAIEKLKNLIIERTKISELNKHEWQRVDNDLNDYMNIASYYDELGEKDSVLFYYRYALKKAVKYNNIAQSSNANVSLADFYFDEEQYELAEAHYLNALELTNEINFNRLSRINYKLYKIYSKTNQKLEAFKYLEAYTELRDTLLKINDKDYALKLEFQKSFQEQTLKDSLSKRKELNEIKLDYAIKQAQNESRNTLYLIIGFSALILVFILLIGFIRKQKHNKVLEEKNKEIADSLELKEELMKEIHHRVKNNMQMVSSLLYLKSKNTLDTKAKSALIDSHQRIKSMQIAHQNMYQNDAFKAMEISNYLQEILEAVTLNIAKENDQFELHSPPFNLGNEKAQALGFVLHELLSNSLKYAWEDEEFGRQITINIVKEEKDIYFTYSDNGKGLESEAEFLDSQSLGSKLIRSFIQRQLNGEFQLKLGKGFNFELKFTSK